MAPSAETSKGQVIKRWSSNNKISIKQAEFFYSDDVIRQQASKWLLSLFIWRDPGTTQFVCWDKMFLATTFVMKT